MYSCITRLRRGAGVCRKAENSTLKKKEKNSEYRVHSNIHLETLDSTGYVSASPPVIPLLQTSPLLRLTMDKSHTVKSNYEKKTA